MLPTFITQIIAFAPIAFGVVGVVVTIFTAFHVAFLTLAGFATMAGFPAVSAWFLKAASVAGVAAADLQKLVALFKKNAPPVSP